MFFVFIIIILCFVFCYRADNAIVWHNIESKLGYKTFSDCVSSKNIDIKLYSWDGNVDCFGKGLMDGEVVFVANLHDFQEHSKLIRGYRNEDYIAAVVIGKTDPKDGNILFMCAPTDGSDKRVCMTKFAQSKLQELSVLSCVDVKIATITLVFGLFFVTVYLFYRAIEMNMVIPLRWLQNKLQRKLKFHRNQNVKIKNKNNDQNDNHFFDPDINYKDIDDNNNTIQ